jgi:D-alanine-D-alanine ligase
VKRLAVAVVQGGPSSEAEVSRASAAAVARALAEAGHEVARLELDAFLAESLRTGGYEVVFPVAHGAVGEDGALQGLLEVLEVPYVGSGVLASALAMDKAMARRLFAACGLRVAKGLALERGDARASAERARKEIGARLVVKPASHGSAIGVARIAEDAPIAEVARALDAAWAFDQIAIVEHFARGREITCGVLDLHGQSARGLPPTEIASPHDAFYTYEARYAPGRSVHTCPAELDREIATEVKRVAVAAHRALCCRDLSRVDFVVGDDDDARAVTLLEVNTMPGMTATSLYPEEAQAAGLAFPALCGALVESARVRGTPRRVAALKMP